MTTQPGAEVASQGSGQVIQGAVLRPGTNQVIKPESTAAHAFFEVLKDIVRKGSFYHSEQQVHDAVAAIDNYRRHVVDPGDQKRVLREEDAGAVEDVRLRKPPAGQGGPAPVAGPAIDYAALAAAIVAQQQAQASQPGPLSQ